MKEYSYSEARKRLSTVLDNAYRDGAVRIKRRDGRVFVVWPEEKSRSPLDVGGVDLKTDRSEILDFVGEGRKKAGESSG